ncbi:arginine--tRNA ligase [Opitutus terrae]|uniref:Arginine--tRNA ligase n=1 Tax=Opitutus terrae (strain DSM 11246 / JCM 15787 / PB90-1) TaxID=452637 RepID=B1ZTW6_OPITP|nr:arginine--tRNA ligase [Opitutus terrae]ACB75848.1 arginyl-tRNA synthetase [Opitutus terrae PB90-1]
MHVPFSLVDELDRVLKSAAAAAGFDAAAFSPEVRVADAQHGDYQANGVLGYAKSRKQNPRALAEKLVAALPAEFTQSTRVTIAGPGFINFTLAPGSLLAWLRTYATAEQLAAGAAADHAGQTWVVDYSSPNTAKQMHVGHLRSAVIGEAICRLLAFTGARVIRDNHLGDWGTQFGKLIYGYKRWADPAALAADPIEELERLYKLGHHATPEGSPELEEAKRELVKLQSGDPENVALWKKFSEVSLGAFQQIYDRLGIHFDHHLGESFYNDKVERVYGELTDIGLAENSDGALVVFHDEHPRFSRNAERPNPFMVRKADGASGYASTDLATALYRTEHFQADGIVIVTDFRQSDHFEQLFLTVKKWFAAKGYRLPQLHHVTFGAVTGEDGKALKTRDGGTIKLKALLDEAVERAFAIVSEKNPELPEDERRAIAEAVGVGAVQYADLSQNRSSNYVFSWEKMLSLEGNTAPYLLYAVARIHSIFRKAGATPGEPATESAATEPETPTEIALARKLLKFPDAVRLATETLRPHFLSLYLFELAGDYSTFNNADRVLVDDPVIRARRLLLCSRTLLILETGLRLLGLRPLTRM